MSSLITNNGKGSRSRKKQSNGKTIKMNLNGKVNEGFDNIIDGKCEKDNRDALDV